VLGRVGRRDPPLGGVHELCIGKSLDFRDNGPLELKGLPEPTQTYGVTWK
jgi:hypothetical protein